MARRLSSCRTPRWISPGCWGGQRSLHDGGNIIRSFSKVSGVYGRLEVLKELGIEVLMISSSDRGERPGSDENHLETTIGL